MVALVTAWQTILTMRCTLGSAGSQLTWSFSSSLKICTLARWPSAFTREDGFPKALLTPFPVYWCSVLGCRVLVNSVYLCLSFKFPDLQVRIIFVLSTGKRSVQFSPCHTGSLACLHRGSRGSCCCHDYSLSLSTVYFWLHWSKRWQAHSDPLLH